MNFNESQKLGCFINIVIRSILLIISVVCVAARGFACIHIFGSFYLGVVSFVFHARFGMSGFLLFKKLQAYFLTIQLIGSANV